MCEVKPMQYIDGIHGLSLYRERAEAYNIQVWHEHLGRDGYHIAPQHGRVLDLQYGCAMVGCPVPCPYWDSTIYYCMLAEWAGREWSPLGGRGANGGQRGQGRGAGLRT